MTNKQIITVVIICVIVRAVFLNFPKGDQFLTGNFS